MTRFNVDNLSYFLQYNAGSDEAKKINTRLRILVAIELEQYII